MAQIANSVAVYPKMFVVSVSPTCVMQLLLLTNAYRKYAVYAYRLLQQQCSVVYDMHPGYFALRQRHDVDDGCVRMVSVIARSMRTRDATRVTWSRVFLLLSHECRVQTASDGRARRALTPHVRARLPFIYGSALSVWQASSRVVDLVVKPLDDGAERVVLRQIATESVRLRRRRFSVLGLCQILRLNLIRRLAIYRQRGVLVPAPQQETKIALALHMLPQRVAVPGL